MDALRNPFERNIGGSIRMPAVSETSSKPYRRIGRTAIRAHSPLLYRARPRRNAGAQQRKPGLAASYWAVAVDESRRQHPLHGDDLRRGDPRIAAAVRLGAEHGDPRRRLVGLRASDPRRLGRAVRHVRLGARPDHHRSRQRAAVHRLRGDLDRRARVRRPSGRAGLSGHRRGAVAAGLPPAGARRGGRCARADRLRHHHRLHLAHGL